MSEASDIVEEMRPFAAFPAATRRYIVRSLDFGLPRGDPMVRWVGSFFDQGVLMAREECYAHVPRLRQALASGMTLERWMPEHAALQRCADFDLQWEEMGDFTAFAFLYERLFGMGVRPWLTSLFASAATAPTVEWSAGCAALASLTMFDGPEYRQGESAARFLPEWDGD